MKIKQEDIVGMMRGGQDKKIIDHLYKTIYPKFSKYVTSRNGNREDAADVFQEVIVLFYKQVMNNTFNEKYKVYGYLFTVCVNKWINFMRKTKNISFTDELEVGTYEIEDHDSGFTLPSNRKNLLTQFFGDLGEKCLELLTYTIYQNMLMEDIALRMGLQSADAAKMQTYRCKQRLFKKLEDNPELKAQLKAAV